MDIDTILQELNNRFALPLPEFYKRRIIFWHDEDGEFQERIDEVTLHNAKLVVLTGTNHFAVKKLLSMDDTTSNFLVYRPFSYENLEDNWLLDIELYSEEFRADLISIWMDELNIPQTPAMRKQVKEYHKFFNAIARREKIKAQGKIPTIPSQLHLAVMGALCGLKNPSPNSILREVLKAGLDKSTNELLRAFVNYGADVPFWSMVRQGSGYEEEEPGLSRLAAHLILTAATRTMRVEHLTGLESFLSTPHQSFCFDFISDWMHSEERDSFFELARTVEEECKLLQRFLKLEVDELLDTEIFPCLDEVILIKRMTEIKNQTVNVEAIRTTVTKRRTMAGYEPFHDYYEGLLQVANMREFYEEHAAGFHFAEARQLWREYASDYYRMDSFYRLFHRSYGESLKSFHSDLHDLFGEVMEWVEHLYKDWFLEKLGSNWFAVCGGDLQKQGWISGIPKQSDFYRKRVANQESRIFIVISDALRYEAAASLAERLRREMRSEVKLQDMQAIFPTITKLGMAALLPHQTLSAELPGNELKILADGTSTDAPYREKILKTANENSAVLSYDTLIGLKRAERSALVRGKEVIYIYHNTIDEASHTSDTAVFSACEDAILELKTLAKLICNDFGATHILFTADHGFLYTYRPLTEDAKLDKTGISDRAVEYGRRYAILRKGEAPDYLQKVEFLDGKTEYDAYAPRENVRIKLSGSGLNFVHGGISLQELVVPVIDFHFLRSDSVSYKAHKERYDTRPVELGLLSSTRKIGNLIFNLDFYQKEAVGDNYEAATYQLFFTDAAGEKISEIVTLFADKTSTDGQERIFRQRFHLKSRKYESTEIYTLVIADESGLPVAREEFSIEIAIETEDFFF